MPRRLSSRQRRATGDILQGHGPSRASASYSPHFCSRRPMASHVWKASLQSRKLRYPRLDPRNDTRPKLTGYPIRLVATGGKQTIAI